MLLELFTFTSFGVYKPHSWDMTSNSLEDIGSENLIELVLDPNNIEMFTLEDGKSTTTALYPFALSMAKLQSKLDAFLDFHEGWDGRGAAPINPLSIENVKAIAEHQWDWDFKLWQIAPGVNGDIFINYKGKNKLAGFVIGPTTFSYFIEDETLQGDSNVPFDGLRVSTLMNTIVNA